MLRAREREFEVRGAVCCVAEAESAVLLCRCGLLLLPGVCGGGPVCALPACPCTCEKMRQREPCCLSRSRSLSSTIIFPAFVTRWSPNGSSDLSSTPSKRYGWLQHLRSCMTRFIKRDLLAVSAADDD